MSNKTKARLLNATPAALPELRKGGETEDLPRAGDDAADDRADDQANDNPSPAGTAGQDQGVVAACGNCLFWLSKDGASGECRARSPLPMLMGFREGLRGPEPVINGFFTPTNSRIWCGDWKPKPNMSVN